MKIIHAETFFARATGLLMRPRLMAGEVLWLRPCRCVHTFGMRYPIAIFFLDQDNLVVEVRPCVRPNRIVYCHKARSVCEMLAISDDQRSTVSALLSLGLLLNTAV